MAVWWTQMRKEIYAYLAHRHRKGDGLAPIRMTSKGKDRLPVLPNLLNILHAARACAHLCFTIV